MAFLLSMYLDVRAQSLKRIQWGKKGKSLSWSKDFFQKKLGLKINGQDMQW